MQFTKQCHIFEDERSEIRFIDILNEFGFIHRTLNYSKKNL